MRNPQNQDQLTSGRTVAFSRDSANVFLHVLTKCNLRCGHCYINPEHHGRRRISRNRAAQWLRIFTGRHPKANLVLLGGEPTLHPELPEIVRDARDLGYASITIDTNGYLFNDILDRVTPEEVDYFSFSLDGPDARVNDPLRGNGCFERCVAGIENAVAAGFQVSVIYTVRRSNRRALSRMPDLLARLGVRRFFIQVIGIRGRSASGAGDADPAAEQLGPDEWLATVPPVARDAADLGISVTWPTVFLPLEQPFECAAQVADNYFIFPNGRVYRCPLCEDFPIHGLQITSDGLEATDRLNETDFFDLRIPEGCVMNRMIQPGNIDYLPDGAPAYRIACCLLKEELTGRDRAQGN